MFRVQIYYISPSLILHVNTFVNLERDSFPFRMLEWSRLEMSVTCYPVAVLVVPAVVSEGCLPTLGQQDLGADVAVGGWFPNH